MALTDNAGGVFCHAELRVCGTDGTLLRVRSQRGYFGVSFSNLFVGGVFFVI